MEMLKKLMESKAAAKFGLAVVAGIGTAIGIGIGRRADNFLFTEKKKETEKKAS